MGAYEEYIKKRKKKDTESEYTYEAYLRRQAENAARDEAINRARIERAVNMDIGSRMAQAAAMTANPPMLNNVDKNIKRHSDVAINRRLQSDYDTALRALTGAGVSATDPYIRNIQKQKALYDNYSRETSDSLANVPENQNEYDMALDILRRHSGQSRSDKDVANDLKKARNELAEANSLVNARNKLSKDISSRAGDTSFSGISNILNEQDADVYSKNASEALEKVAAMRADYNKKKDNYDRLVNEAAVREETKKYNETHSKYSDIPKRADFANIAARGRMRNDNQLEYKKDQYRVGNQSSMLSTLDYADELTGNNDGNYVTENEKDIYGYLLEKEGRESAEEYRKYIQDDINYRKGSFKYSMIPDNTAAKVLSGVGLGMDRTKNSMRNLVNDIFGSEAMPVSAEEYASSFVREDLRDKGLNILGSSLGQAAYDALDNIGNMIPMMGFGSAGAAVGMGVSSGATSMNEAWRNGSSKGQAAAYGIANGTLEGGLQYALGGIGKLGGKLTGVGKNIIDTKVSNALARTAAKVGLSALGEGTEEYLQEVIDPVVRNITLGENNKIRFASDEALYAGLLGAVSGLALGGPSDISEEMNRTRATERIGAYTDIDAVVDAAKDINGLEAYVSRYETDPTDYNAGMLKLEFDNYVGESIVNARTTEEANKAYDEITENAPDVVVQVADEALDNVKSGIENANIDFENENSNYEHENSGFEYENSGFEYTNGNYDINIDTDSNTSAVIDTFSDETRNAMEQSLHTAVVDEVTYKNAFANYYSYGRAGLSMETAEKNATFNELTDSQKKLAYNSGVQDRQAQINQAEQNVSKKEFKGTGMVRYIRDNELSEGISVPRAIKELDERQKSSVMALRTFAEVSGQNIVLYESQAVNGKVTAPNGWYNKNNDTIYIDVNAGDVGESAILRTASHEITHSIKEWSPKRYAELQDFVTRQFEQDGSIEAMINEEIRIAKSNGQNMTFEEALDEVTANACEMMLKDSNAIETMAAESPNLCKKIKTVIDRIIADIKKAFEGLRSGSLEHKRMSEMLDDWTGIQKMWDDAVVDSAKNAKKARKSDESVQDNVESGNNVYSSRKFDDVKFNDDEIVYIDDKEFNRRSLSNNSKYSDVRKKVEQILRQLAEQYTYIHNKDTGEKIYLDIIFADEYANSKDSITNNNTRKNAKMNGAKYVKQMIENAKYYNHSDSKKQKSIDDSNGYNYYKVLFGLKNDNGYSMYSGTLVARINSKGKIYAYDIIKLSADYGSQPQSPGKEPLSADNEDIISDKKNDVNKKFSHRDNTGKELSSEQAEYFKDSKVRDEDGNLKVVYHGTNSDFNTFSYDYIGKNGSAEGYGFYFTDSREKAAGYSKGERNIKELYLDIKKPLSSEDVTLKRSDIKKLINEIDPTGDEIVSNYESTGRGYPSKEWYNRGLEETIDILFENSSDLDIICELGNASDVKDINETVYDILGYDGYIEKSKYEDGEVYVAFKSSQVKNIDNLNPTDNEDIRFSYRGDTRSDREILADALMSATKNNAERNELEAYKKIIGTLDMQEKLRREKVRLRNAAETAQERDRYQADIDKIDKKIAFNDKKLIRMEAAAPLRAVIKREAKADSEKDIEYIKARYKQSQERKSMTTLRNNIKNNAGSLINLINKPTNQRHVPESIKKPVADFLASIDFISAYANPESFNTMQWQTKMDKLRDNIQSFTENDGSIDFDPDLLARMYQFTHNEKGEPLPAKKLSDMNMKELEDLYIIVRSLRMGIANTNRLFANKRSDNAEKLGYDTIQELKKRKTKKAHSKLVNTLDNFINVDLLDPTSFFNSLGENAESIYRELTTGRAVRKRDIKKAAEYVDDIHNNIGISSKEIEAIKRDKKVHTFQYLDREFKITTGEIMSLYCLKKRPQAMKHMENGGIRIDTFEYKGKEIVQTDTFIMTEAFINKITSVLTENEKKLAMALQSYMANQCAEQGNETSMTLYGYKKFGEKDYFPIKSNPDDLQQNKADKNVSTSLTAIVNKGMTKNLEEKPDNSIMVSNIYDVFVNHVTDMADYHGMAVPLTDTVKWYNYKYPSEGTNDNIKQSISRVFGEKYNDYFTNFIRDINGDSQRRLASDPTDIFVKNFKATAVAANMRVVVQQPSAYVRAASMIDTKYLVKAVGMKPGIKEATENSTLAWQKSVGFFDTGLGTSLKNLITNDKSVTEKIVDKSLWLAGKADELTWGCLWNAVKLEVADQNKALDTKSKEFMEKVTERFDDIVYSTQVVDDIFSKTQIMRNKDGKIRSLTSFMAEPLKSYNMLRNAVVSGNKKTIARTAGVFIVNSAATSMAAALIDAMRSLSNDDDKDKNFAERYWDNFGQNMIDNANPLNLVPYVRDFVNAIAGYSSNKDETVWMTSTVKACTEVYKAFNGNSKKTPSQITMMCAKAISQMSGIPVANAYRTFESLYNEINASILGKKSLGYYADKAAVARMDGNIKEYESIVKELQGDGYSIEDINKKVRSATNKLNKNKKEAAKELIDNTEADTEEEKEESIYKASDVLSLIENNDLTYAQKVLDSLYETELVDTPDRVEAYKALKRSIKTQISRYYKSLEYKDRLLLRKSLGQLRIAKQSIYDNKDYELLEKAIVREKAEENKK